MKKLFVGVLAIASMVACMNEETVRVQDGNPIAFENTYVQNATRANDPSTTTNNIQEFSVWAYMNAVDGVVFDDETVSRSGDDWTYTNTQYWMPGNNYFFAAFAGDRTAIETLPETMDENGLGEVKFTNVDGTNDILYAEAVVENAEADQEPVALTFKHLLSKVKFTFKNGFQNDNNFVVVKNITMDVAETAYVDLSADADFANRESVLPWTNLAGTTTLEFGDVNKLEIGFSEAAENERLTIPADANYEYVINFDVEVYNGSVLGLQKSMEVKLSGLELVAGRAYNLMATINQENLNLNKIEFLVEVDEWIEQDVDGGAVEGDVRFVSTIGELQTILNAATGDLSVVLGADLTGNVNVPELANATIAINGNGHKFDGTFALVGGSTYGEGTTVFSNINFESAGLNGYDSFIYCNEQNGNTRYPDNVTIKDCTFTATGTTDVVGAKFRSLNGKFLVENCEAKGTHSMFQLLSCGKADVLVDGVKISNSKNGISLEKTGNTVIRNSNIVAREYGIRADGCVATTNIENSTIEAKQPVIVRKVTAAGYTVNVDDASVLTTTGDYDVIFTKGSDDAAYEAPAVDFAFNGPADLVVFPQTVVVHNADEMAAALKAEAQKINVKLANDIEVAISSIGTTASGDAKQMGGANTEAITIDLNGNKLNLTTTYWSVLGAKNSDAIVTIKNGTMTSSQTTGTWNSYDLSFSNCNYAFENVVFEKAIALEAANKSYNLKNVTINETHDYYAMWITAEGQNVTIDGLTVNSLGRGIKIDEQYVDAPAKVTLNIANATFKTANKAAILVKSVAGAEINWGAGNSIAEVAEDTDFAVWVDEDAAAYADLVVVNGALVKVEGANTQAIATDTELREALKNGNDVVLTEDITTTDADSNGYGATGININGGVFDGNGHTIEVEGATSTWDSAIAIKGGTIKNVTVAKGFRGIFFKNGTEKIVLENVIINGPTYTISCDSAGNQGFEAYNSKFYGWTSYAGTIGTGYFEGCTFGKGAGYNFSRPYAPTTYVNCDFEAGHKIDARAAVSFENCRFNGVALTADNIATLVTGNVQNVVEVK